MRRIWVLAAALVAALGVCAAVVAADTIGTVSACATTPAQTISDNGTDISTVPAQTACNTVTYTESTVTNTVTQTVTVTGTTTVPPTTTTAAPSYLLDDEFNGPAGSKPSSTLWAAKTGQTQGGTVFDGMNQVSENGQGDLVITAYKDSTGLWHSGWLSSKIAITGPRDVVARGMVPCGYGTWASPVWEWGYPYGAAPELEDDVIEQLGREPTVYHSTLHYAAVAGGGKTDQSGGPIDTGVTLCNAFHTYEAKIYPDRAEFYFDGKLEKTIPVTALTGITDLTAMKEAENIQLTMGGWGGTPTISGPVSMLVDYVRVSAL